MAESGKQVALLIRNPQSHRADFNISVPLDSTIAELKTILQQKYEGNPAPAEQTVRIGVHARTASLESIFGSPPPPPFLYAATRATLL